MDLVGKYIGSRYEILEVIGKGGMATVYRAKCHVLNRMVAVKVLKEEFTTDEEFIRRFNIEAQSAAGLSHPNIVSIYDVGHEGSIYYIVMELIQGKTLKEIIAEDGALPWKWSVNIAIQIASATSSSVFLLLGPNHFSSSPNAVLANTTAFSFNTSLVLPSLVPSYIPSLLRHCVGAKTRP